jgi:hypothetical protein
MMDRLIQLKKFSFVTVFISALVIATSAMGDAGQLPQLRNVGVVPAQVRNPKSFQDVHENLTRLDASFPKAVQATTKFRMIDVELVRGLWSNADGRKELVDEHELHAFITLEASVKSDTVLLYARLLSPALDSYLVESVAVPRSEFARSEFAQLQERIDDLIARVVNRLPIDTTVTSIEGRFVTMSAGTNQSLQQDDELTIVRPRIAAVNPANGAWTKFDAAMIGRVRIIEAKKTSAIGEIIQLTNDDSIKVGDGARIDAVASRRRFNKPKTEAKPSVDPVAAAHDDGKHIETANHEAPAHETPHEAAPSNAPKSPQHHASAPSKGATEASAGAIGLAKKIRPYLDNAFVEVGSKGWSVSDAASAEADFSVIQHFRVNAGKQLDPALTVQVDARGFTGTTELGTFQGFEVDGRAFTVRSMDGGLRARLGGGATLTSMAVTKQTFGGADIVSGYGMAALEMTKRLGSDNYDFLGELVIRPLNIGQIGAGGSKKQISSSLQTDMSLGAFRRAPALAPEYGASLEYRKASFGLGTGALAWTEASILFGARVQL